MDWGAVAPPFTYDFEDLVDALVAMTVGCHDGIAKSLRCFSPPLTPEAESEEKARVRQVVMSTFSTYFGCGPEDRFADVFEQSCYFAEHLAKDHVFSDGNKRTALVMAMAFIVSRHISISFSDDPEESFNSFWRWIQDIVSGQRTVEELADDLRAHAALVSADSDVDGGSA